MYMTRTYAFSVHRDKQRLLGRWPEKAVQNPTLVPRLGTTTNKDLPATNSCSVIDYDNISLIAGDTNAMPSSPARDVSPAARQAGGAVTIPEVAGVPPGAARRAAVPCTATSRLRGLTGEDWRGLKDRMADR